MGKQSKTWTVYYKYR